MSISFGAIRIISGKKEAVYKKGNETPSSVVLIESILSRGETGNKVMATVLTRPDEPEFWQSYYGLDMDNPPKSMVEIIAEKFLRHGIRITPLLKYVSQHRVGETTMRSAAKDQETFRQNVKDYVTNHPKGIKSYLV